MNISSDLRPYLETKPHESYPRDLIQNMKMITFFHEGLAVPFGSYIYKMQKYPGDVDLLEEFEDCCSPDKVIRKFIKSLLRVVKDIKSSKLHYFSEFKAGIDHIYDIDIGKLENGIYYINPLLKEISINLYKKKFLDKNEIVDILKIINRGIFTGDGYDIIFNIYRNRRILRWSVKEIEDGYKMLHGKKKKLYDALFDETHVKIDVLLLYNNRFIEMTNFVGLAYEDENKEIHFININLEKIHNIPITLPPEIEKLYFSNYYYSPFKMTKRIYSLSRNKQDENTLWKIIPLITGDVSLLYQIRSEIDVLLLILEKVKVPPIKTINKQLDEMKSRITFILEINDYRQIIIFSLINKAIDTKSIKNKIELLEKLNNSYFKPDINRLTIEYLETVGFNPPPHYLLPPEMSYAEIIRSPYDIPDIKKILI